MISTVRFLLVIGALALVPPPLAAQSSAGLAAEETDAALLAYPDRIQGIIKPVNVRLRYATSPERRFVTDLIWGPEQAPGLYRLRAQGTVTIAETPEGPVMTLERSATDFTAGPKSAARDDDGTIIARLTPTGGYRQIELRLDKLDTKAHRDQFDVIGTHLIDTGRIPLFERLALRTGPDDTGGAAQARRERTARTDLLEAMQPMLGLVLDLPDEGVSTGDTLTVLRRDLGELFRGADPIPLRIDGEVVGLADVADKRMLVLKLLNADLTPPMRALVDGYALIDIQTGLPQTVVARIELVILQGTDVTVFNFVERRALLPAAAR